MSSRSNSMLLVICIICLAGLTGCKSYLPKTALAAPEALNGRLTVGGDNRTYRLHIPEGYANEKPVPLVLALHGAFSSGRKMERFSGFSALADKEGFIMVYPDGIGLFGLLRHWNAGFCCGRAMTANWNDTAFLLRLIDVLSEHLAVDPKRIYLVGMSNGGMLAHRFAAEHPQRIAAVALVAAAVGARWQEHGEMLGVLPPSLPVPAIIIHAKDDPVIPFEGGRGDNRDDVEYLGPKDAVAFWCGANQCGEVPVENVRFQEKGDWLRWDTCMGGAEVAFLAVDKGGHVWPGELTDPPNPSADNISGTEAAWRFLSRFSRE
ncbi:MAG: extracellular catalytic domain type 1 short-chain-length polyhydroxyalkanoate depolymerase [Thermodesulfobacteriota bacterium]